MIPAGEIVVDRTYAGASDRSRHVVWVENGYVGYTVAGLLSIVPFRAKLEEFAAWADRRIA
jgi:hypothetical protein